MRFLHHSPVCVPLSTHSRVVLASSDVARRSTISLFFFQLYAEIVKSSEPVTIMRYLLDYAGNSAIA